MPISKRDVDGVTPGTLLWDTGRGAVTGFGLRCQKSAKVYVLKYAFGGRSRWYTIGKHGVPWTVESARREALKLLGDVATGSDPAADKQGRRRAEKPMMMAELCDRYMAAAQRGLVLTRFNRPKKASTLAIDVGRVDRHIKPLVGSLPVRDFDARAVKRLIADIAAGKTAADCKTGTRGRAVVTGGAGTAARVADLLSGIMAWALDEEYVDHNPVHGIRRYRGEPRQRYLSADELGRFGTIIRRGTDLFGKPIHPYAIAIVELLALTGCRLNEIAELRWDEIDFQDRCLRLADTKTGQSMRAIGHAVFEIIRQRSCHKGNEYVFPASRGDGAYQGTKREIKRIFAAAEITNASSHTLRHTFGSMASELGFSDATIAGLLGHAGRGVTSRYIHRPDSAIMSAADVVATRMAEILSTSIPAGCSSQAGTG